ncbi:MAG: DNA/RNA nuclease SfsA [Rhodobacteraceae bacterium]|nr:DNA/RNA nuclease SfsA [Paracoccaceae bacterium]
MNFTNTLIKGKLVKRYKRFFTDIEVNNKIVTAHCPNTGSMKGLLDKGNEVWISPQNDPSRKLKFTLELIKVKKKLVGVNTHRANRIVQHGLENKLISEFKCTKNIKPEFKYSPDTRFDFLCDKSLLEVKNVTLISNDEVAEFPDAVTERGLKHLKMLINSIEKGYKPYVLFLTQIQGINNFRIAKEIDPNYFKGYIEARKAGVKFLAYRCTLNSKQIKIEKKIKIIDAK